jgi:hypothetical protein
LHFHDVPIKAREHMVKRLLVLAALLPLAACIPVEDFGASWDKATLDRGLAGAWKQVATRPDQDRDHGYGTGNVIRLVVKDNAYEMSVYGEDGKLTDRPQYPIKTLNAGRYRFLAAGPKRGLMSMYKLTGGTLTFCDAVGTMVEFVQTHYPNAINVKRGEGEYLTIALLDNEAVTILSGIPDTDTYWMCDSKLERVP